MENTVDKLTKMDIETGIRSFIREKVVAFLEDIYKKDLTIRDAGVIENLFNKSYWNKRIDEVEKFLFLENKDGKFTESILNCLIEILSNEEIVKKFATDYSMIHDIMESNIDIDYDNLKNNIFIDKIQGIGLEYVDSDDSYIYDIKNKYNAITFLPDSQGNKLSFIALTYPDSFSPTSTEVLEKIQDLVFEDFDSEDIFTILENYKEAFSMEQYYKGDYIESSAYLYNDRWRNTFTVRGRYGNTFVVETKDFFDEFENCKKEIIVDTFCIKDINTNAKYEDTLLRLKGFSGSLKQLENSMENIGLEVKITENKDVLDRKIIEFTTKSGVYKYKLTLNNDIKPDKVYKNDYQILVVDEEWIKL